VLIQLHTEATRWLATAERPTVRLPQEYRLASLSACRAAFHVEMVPWGSTSTARPGGCTASEMVGKWRPSAGRFLDLGRLEFLFGTPGVASQMAAHGNRNQCRNRNLVDDILCSPLG